MKRLIQLIAITALMVIGATCFTSCDDGHYPPPPPTPGGGGSYYDPALYGDWELIQIDGIAIRPYERNYMCFFAGGGGEYYYMMNGYPYAEDIYYWCGTDGYGDSIVTITYSDGQTSTMYYWFEGNSLLLQWYTGNNRPVTYRYLPASHIPW